MTGSLPTQPTQPARPFDVPAASHSYLVRSAASLHEAITTSEIPLRYAHAHVAALRATAALLAARATPVPTGARSGRGRPIQRNAWVLLAKVAPEFTEWARFFSAGAAKRAAAEAGSMRAVTEREADDLVREADRFLALVEESLGLIRHVPVPEHLPCQPQGPGRSDRPDRSGWRVA
ncbi:MAG: chromosome segregation protein SMC [Nocardioidaceae bacterium]|nr:chromosome segregation protein SMC [Nocardioidaceae bacterium]